MSKGSWNIGILLGGAALCAALVLIGVRYPGLFVAPGLTPSEQEALLLRQGSSWPTSIHPVGQLLKLVMAAGLGLLITVVHKRFHRDKPISRSMEQAQILLCVSGALIMILIGDSIARAFGIAGAASIIRFRTPVEDPKDSVILFLLIGLGMACGLGALGVAGLGTAFLCVVLYGLHRVGEQKPRAFMLSLASDDGKEFPTGHVQALFAAYSISFERRETTPSSVKYHVTLGPDVPLEFLNDQLLGGGYSGITSVTWESPKKSG